MFPQSFFLLGMIIFAVNNVMIGLFLGGASGVNNMIRSAKIIDKKLREQQTDDDNI